MWFLPILVLSVLSSVISETTDFYLPVLNSPTNLTVGDESDKAVVVCWDFVKPRTVSLRRVEFVLLLEDAINGLRTFYPRFRSKPLNYTLVGLSPDTEYSVRLLATSPKWRDSSTAGITFSTLQKDWPTPLITRMSSRTFDDFVDYLVGWSTEPVSPELTHFEVELCDTSCSTIRKKRFDHDTVVSIEYNTEFTVRVIACYDLPIVGKIKRFSETFHGNTGKGSPGRILTRTYAGKVRNKIRLPWLPSFGPRGPTTYYEFFVIDPSLKSNVFEEDALPEDPRVSLRYPNIVGDVYELKLGAAEDEFSTESQLTSRGDPRPDQCAPPEPLLVLFMKRTLSAVRFRVIFQKFGLTGRSMHDSRVGHRHLLIGSGMAETFGFSAYATLGYGIRSCLTYHGRDFDVCGNFTFLDSVSDVAEPSEVDKLTWYFEDPRKVVITWEKPGTPRGPIDGYKLSIRRTYGRTIESKEVMLNSSTRSYVIEAFQRQRTYRIGVAAYNLESERKNEMRLGNWKYVTPSREGFFWWIFSLAF